MCLYSCSCSYICVCVYIVFCIVLVKVNNTAYRMQIKFKLHFKI